MRVRDQENDMQKNVGNIERILRVCAGLILVAIAVFATNLEYSWVGWIGIVPLLTGLLGRCPAYSLFGINTCRLS